MLQAGRYTNLEENPFFPENLPPSVEPHYPFSQVIRQKLFHDLPLYIIGEKSIS